MSVEKGIMCKLTLMALRTIMIASCSDRSVSSVNCSAPPLKMMVHVLAFGQPLKKLYLHRKMMGLSNQSNNILIALYMLCSEEDGLTVLNMSVLPLSSNLDLFKEFALSQDIVCHCTNWGLDGATTSLEITLHQISHIYANMLIQTEDVSVRHMIADISVNISGLNNAVCLRVLPSWFSLDPLPELCQHRTGLCRRSTGWPHHQLATLTEPPWLQTCRSSPVCHTECSTLHQRWPDSPAGRGKVSEI